MFSLSPPFHQENATSIVISEQTQYIIYLCIHLNYIPHICTTEIVWISMTLSNNLPPSLMSNKGVTRWFVSYFAHLTLSWQPSQKKTKHVLSFLQEQLEGKVSKYLNSTFLILIYSERKLLLLNSSWNQFPARIREAEKGHEGKIRELGWEGGGVKLGNWL